MTEAPVCDWFLVDADMRRFYPGIQPEELTMRQHDELRSAMPMLHAMEHGDEHAFHRARAERIRDLNDGSR